MQTVSQSVTVHRQLSLHPTHRNFWTGRPKTHRPRSTHALWHGCFLTNIKIEFIRSLGSQEGQNGAFTWPQLCIFPVTHWERNQNPPTLWGLGRSPKVQDTNLAFLLRHFPFSSCFCRDLFFFGKPYSRFHEISAIATANSTRILPSEAKFLLARRPNDKTRPQSPKLWFTSSCS